jgi:hypothetical protein
LNDLIDSIKKDSNVFEIFNEVKIKLRNKEYDNFQTTKGGIVMRLRCDSLGGGNIVSKQQFFWTYIK